eukprot:365014-Chlamydomonas_euryale.AAC.7
MPVASRADVVAMLRDAGFSVSISQWAATNLRPAPGGAAGRMPAGGAASATPLTWMFDLEGIKEMYESYEVTCLYDLLEAPPQGLRLDFVKAEHSNFRWGGSDEARIVAAGHRVHLLRGAGHWVHSDNPAGLLQILAGSFGLQAKKFGQAVRAGR